MQLQPKEYISLCGNTNVNGMMHMVAMSTSVVLKCSTKCFTWDMDSIEDVFVESSINHKGYSFIKDLRSKHNRLGYSVSVTQ